MEFFTADWHFDHENIIESCNRPFKNAYQMNKEIIKRFNEKVTNNDTVYVIGDVTLCAGSDIHRIEKYIKSMNGTKILILGNHDRFKPFDYIDIGFQSVHTYLKYNKFHLIHDPAGANLDIYNNWIVGHIHNIFKIIQREHSKIINVGVDVWNFYPVSLDEVCYGESGLNLTDLLDDASKLKNFDNLTKSEEFKNQLKEASKIVYSWPDWKQKI